MKRASVRPESPWYVGPAISKALRVTLDGRPMLGVLEADVAAGVVERARQNADGSFVVVGDLVVTEFVFGAVRIIEEPRCRS